MEKSGFRTEGLVVVAARLRELRTQVSDAEWNGSKDLQYLLSELKYYEHLSKSGVIYGTLF